MNPVRFNIQSLKYQTFTLYGYKNLCLWQRLNSFVTGTKPCKNKTKKSFSNWVASDSAESLKTATTTEEKNGAELSENGMKEEYETSWR